MEEKNFYKYQEQSEQLRDKRRRIGSQTAKGGFKNEKHICEKFNNWKIDSDVKEWLKIMNYDFNKLDSLEAIKIPTLIKKIDLQKYNITTDEYEKFIRFKKADAQLKLILKIGDIIKFEYLSLKKANKGADFNQIDKRSVNDYKKMWNFNNEITKWLKLFTGETKPDRKVFKNLYDNRRILLNEMSENIQKIIIKFFDDNKYLIISDILKGRGGLSAGWLLVTRLDTDTNKIDYVLKDINTVINFYSQGKTYITQRGSLFIGKIFMQRKGGTPDPTKLQFKFGPCQLFKIK